MLLYYMQRKMLNIRGWIEKLLVWKCLKVNLSSESTEYVNKQ